MEDNKPQENRFKETLRDIAPSLGSEEEAPLASNYPDKKSGFVTAGERIHHWSTYLGIDWIFNAMSGVSFAYFTKYTDFGKKYWSGPITSFFDKALKPLIKNDAQRKSSAGYGNMFMSIIAGGMFTIPPLMVLESKKIKKAIVKFYDRLIYGKDKVENDSKFQEAYSDIDNAPKKDFTSGLIARFFALAPLLAMVLIPTSKKAADKVWFNHVEHASDATAKKMGFGPESFKKIPPAEGKERWKFIHESVAMDAGLGIPYAVLHSFFYNIFAGLLGKKGKAGSEMPAASIQKNNAVITDETASKTAKAAQNGKPSSQVKEAEAEAAISQATAVAR